GLMICQSGEAHLASRRAVAAIMPALADRWIGPRLQEAAVRLVAGLPGDGIVDLMEPITNALPNLVAAAHFCIYAAMIGPLRETACQLIDVWRPMAPLREYRRLEEVAREVRSTLSALPRTSSRLPLPGIPEHALADLEAFLITATVATTSASIAGALHI